MTFEELSKKIVALRIVSINLEYSNLEIIIVAKPEYGFKPEFKEKKITFAFNNCIFFATSNFSSKKSDSTVEVISWGEKKEFSILKYFFSDSIAKDFNKSKLSNIDYENLPGDYSLYYFENTFGDLIKIIANKVGIEIEDSGKV